MGRAFGAHWQLLFDSATRGDAKKAPSRILDRHAFSTHCSRPSHKATPRQRSATPRQRAVLNLIFIAALTHSGSAASARCDRPLGPRAYCRCCRGPRAMRADGHLLGATQRRAKPWAKHRPPPLQHSSLSRRLAAVEAVNTANITRPARSTPSARFANPPSHPLSAARLWSAGVAPVAPAVAPCWLLLVAAC